MSGSTATLERTPANSSHNPTNPSRPTQPLIANGEVKCPVPGLVCNVYSRSSNQFMRQVTFLSYVHPAQISRVGFMAGDLLVHILDEDKPTQARALGVFPFGHIESDYISPLYCKPADD